MISLVEVLKIRINRSSLAYRKPTKTKANNKTAEKSVDTYRKISKPLVDKSDVKGKSWGSKKMK